MTHGQITDKMRAVELTRKNEMIDINELRFDENGLTPAVAVDAGAGAEPFSPEVLMRSISDRKANPKPGSYTTYLFEKGVDKILKKLGEESTGVIIAGKAGDKSETIYKLADLAYHAMVLMAELGITVGDVKNELASRHVADKK